MNFFDKCYDLFMETSKYHDLGKDIQNYNKIVYYLNNFISIDRQEIESFIIEVRSENIIYSAICQLLNKVTINVPIKKLYELNFYELYNELKGEIANIVLKGAYDSIKLLNDLTEQQENELSFRIASGDISIFSEYKCI